MILRIIVPITPEIESYIDEVGYREHPVLAECRAEAQTRGAMAVMQIAPEQGAFLQLLIEITGARHVLEIGAFTGYSTLAMALSLPESGQITTCDIDEAVINVARQFWAKAGVTHRIDVRIADAEKTLGDLSDHGASFDLILIDADKPKYPTYLEYAIKLVKVGGLIVVDDTLIHGRVVTGSLDGDPDYVRPAVEAMRLVNKRLHNDERLTIAMVPAHDGWTLARRRF